LTCFSDKTFKVLRNAFQEKLTLGFPAPRIFEKRNEEESPEVAAEPIDEGYGNGQLYEPSRMVNVWSLRLGSEGGEEGWYRVWQWCKQAQEITQASFQRFCEIRG
jgi:hypothetical protein